MTVNIIEGDESRLWRFAKLEMIIKSCRTEQKYIGKNRYRWKEEEEQMEMRRGVDVKRKK